MNDSIVAAVKDVSSDDLSEECNVEAYFNSGVILIDVNKWNEANITECCIQLLSKKRWKYLDQDILNIVLNKKVVLLEERYNFQYSLSRILNRGFFAYHNLIPTIKNTISIIEKYIFMPRKGEKCVLRRIYILRAYERSNFFGMDRSTQVPCRDCRVGRQLCLARAQGLEILGVLPLSSRKDPVVHR